MPKFLGCKIRNKLKIVDIYAYYTYNYYIIQRGKTMDTAIYLVVFKEEKGQYLAKIPDFDIEVKGASLEETILSARSAIAKRLFSDESYLYSANKSMKYECAEDEFVALIDIDLVKYRRKYDNRRIRKNLTIPNWLNEEAEKQDVNFSRVLEEAIKRKLNYQD